MDVNLDTVTRNQNSHSVSVNELEEGSEISRRVMVLFTVMVLAFVLDYLSSFFSPRLCEFLLCRHANYRTVYDSFFSINVKFMILKF